MTDEELAWETADSHIAYTCEGFDVRNDDVRFPDGSEGEFDYLEEGESVVVLPLTGEGDVVVIEEWRQAVKRVNLGLPAGTMESDDADPSATVRRELREEAGYEAGGVDHMATFEPANGLADSVFHYFVARDCEPTAEQDLDVGEFIDVQTTSVDTLLEAARADELRDGRSALGLFYYALFER